MHFLPLAVAALIASGLACAQAASAPAFPGALGFGASTPGGRGGEIIRVTTLAPEGVGSIAAAFRKKGPRIIVFEVGGVIDLAGKRLKLSEPFVTIAGATAPAPGITLIRGGIDITAHDVIVQHIAVRPGEAGRAKKSGWEVDGVSTIGASNVLIDHCSFTWATDENLSASGARFDGETVSDWRAKTSHHITFSNCLIAEALSRSTHEKGEHSKGTLLHDNGTNLSVIGNLYACNVERNPLTKGGVHAVIVNNWISNPGRRAIHSALVPEEWKGHEPVTSQLAIVGNLLEHGPDSPARLALFLNHGPTPLELFAEDNLALDRAGQAAPLFDPKSLPLARTRPVWPEGLEAIPAAQVKESVAKNVGARPWDRDPIDERIVRAALERAGKIIDGESEVGGYPERPATRAPFNVEEWHLATMQRRK
jgi:hypothetical protein